MDPQIERLVEELLPQARSEAWKRFQSAPQQLDLDELISLAYAGLMMAAARWPAYCAQNGYDSAAVQYFAAYALRRIRGSILDAMRSSDWVTRSTRARAKALRAAGQDLGISEDELVARTGLSARQVRETLASVARRPVSMDAEPVDVAEGTDVEGQAVVHSVLEAVVAASAGLPPDVQVVLALHYHQGKDLREIAGLLGMAEARASELLTEAVLEIHDAMVRAVAD